MALPKDLSKRSDKERTEILIKHYQNAYDIWSQHKGVDQEMLKNWLFLIEALSSHQAYLISITPPGEK